MTFITQSGVTCSTADPQGSNPGCGNGILDGDKNALGSFTQIYREREVREGREVIKRASTLDLGAR